MAGDAARLPSTRTRNAATRKTGNQPPRCRAVRDMLTPGKATAVPAVRDDAKAKRTTHIEPWASSRARDAEPSRRHVGGCRHVGSRLTPAGSHPGPVDTELLDPRLKRRPLQAKAGGGPLRTSEHPVALVQRTENRLALRRLEGRRAGSRRGRAIAELRHDHAKGGSRRQDDGALHRILELPNISRPPIACERRHRLCGDGLDALV